MEVYIANKSQQGKSIFNQKFYIPDYFNNHEYYPSVRYEYKYDGSEKPPIITIGCSYMFGHGIPPEKSFQRRLSNIMKRNIYNISELGYSPVEMLAAIDSCKCLRELPEEPEFVIYTFMYDHPNRDPNDFAKLDYMRKNNAIPFQKYSFFDNFYFVKNYKKYLYTKYKDSIDPYKYYSDYIRTCVLMMNDKIKKLYPNTQFVVLVYSDDEHNINQNIIAYRDLFEEYKEAEDSELMDENLYKILHDRDLWSEIESHGMKVIFTEDLLGRTMNRPEERLTPDFAWTIHPSAFAWEELTPLIAEKLEELEQNK